MNYIGSKQKLSDFIISTIGQEAGSLEGKTFAELFAGTGIISRKLKSKVASIIANDIEYFSYVLLRNYIGNYKPLRYEKYIAKLNSTAGREGFIYKNYCMGGSGKRNYFTDSNGKKIDAARMKIEKWKIENKIDEQLYYFLLAGLIEAADKVANTASVYGAYLKHIKKTAKVPLSIEPPLFEPNGPNNKVFREEANKLILKIKGDILYLDPPYNHRQYGANYHILNTIAEHKFFEPRGITGLPDYYKSDYCIKGKAEAALEHLISSADFELIFLSYNNEGIIDCRKIKKILSAYGNYKLEKFEGYQRFKADSDKSRKYSANSTTEYLHILKKK